MLPVALSVLGFGKTILQGIIGWLSRRSPGELVAIALMLALAIDHLALLASHRHSAKVESQLAKCADANSKLAAQSKVQIQTQTRTVDHYIKVEVPQVKTIVQKVESAPLPGNCKTPQEVTNADL